MFCSNYQGYLQETPVTTIYFNRLWDFIDFIHFGQATDSIIRVGCWNVMAKPIILKKLINLTMASVEQSPNEVTIGSNRSNFHYYDLKQENTLSLLHTLLFRN